MSFWKLAFEQKWIDVSQLRKVVKTDANLFGEITPQQFADITGQAF
ncbi:XkdX family protein [Paenibacillus sp. 481]|nr:XkdX family protein [Paenibacillus sp. 481]UHA72307.1 XkdX family protein [Paenibacillus sp. 481]